MYVLKIKDLIEEKSQSLDKKVIDFISTIDLDRATYLCDLIDEYAEEHTDIYNAKLLQFLGNNIRDVEEVITDYGWSDLGRDLMKAVAIAEERQITRLMLENENAIIYIIAMTYLSRLSNVITYSQEQVLSKILVRDFDRNNRIDEIVDVAHEIFLGKGE